MDGLKLMQPIRFWIFCHEVTNADKRLQTFQIKHELAFMIATS